MFAKLKKYSSTLGGMLMSIAITFGIIVLCMIIYFYVYLPAITNHGETITVPNIEGMTIAELEDFLETKDLRYEVNDSSYAEDAPPLTVLKQYPGANSKVKEGRVIYISVNRVTPPTVPVPNLIDGSLINADAVLRSNELKRGRIELVRGPFLQVVKGMKYKGQVLLPGTRLPKGSAIDLVVEDGGTNSFVLQDLVNEELEDAKFVLKGVYVTIDLIVVGDTTGIIPVVLKQKPEGGQNIRVGDIVKLWVGEAGTDVPEEDEETDQ